MARGRKAAAVPDGPVKGPWDLPKGWRWERIEAVAPVNPRRKFDHLSSDAQVVFVPMAAVQELNGEIDVSETRPVSTVQSGFSRFASGDVIFAKITPCMENGKLAVVPPVPHDMAAGSTEFLVLEPRGVSARYLFHFLSQAIFRDAAEHNMTGTAGQKRVPSDWLRNAPIPVPPTREVEAAIVRKLDDLLDEIDDGEVALHEAQQATEVHRQAVLKAANTGRLTAAWRASNAGHETGDVFLERIRTTCTQAGGGAAKAARPGQELGGLTTDTLPVLPQGWVWTNLESLASAPPRNGLSIKGVEGPTAVRGLRLDALAEQRVDWSRTRYLPRTRAEVSQYLLEDGDLLVSRANGSPHLVGKASICEAPPEDVIFPDTAFRFRLGGPPSLRDWVLAQWSSILVRAQIVGLAKTTAGILKISQGDLRKVAIPLPGQTEMEAALRLISESLSAVDDASVCIDAADAGITLRQSILAAAFRGDLIIESQA